MLDGIHNTEAAIQQAAGQVSQAVAGYLADGVAITADAEITVDKIANFPISLHLASHIEARIRPIVKET